MLDLEECSSGPNLLQVDSHFGNHVVVAKNLYLKNDRILIKLSCCGCRSSVTETAASEQTSALAIAFFLCFKLDH